jgi:hypothetical protein
MTTTSIQEDVTTTSVEKIEFTMTEQIEEVAEKVEEESTSTEIDNSTETISSMSSRLGWTFIRAIKESLIQYVLISPAMP